MITPSNISTIRVNDKDRPSKCEGCPFPGKTCGSRGDPKAPIVIVGESPGATETIHNMPFAGPSGDLMREMLPIDVNLDESTYVLNALQCKPRGKSDERMNKAIHCCHGRLIAQIQEYPREIVLAFGNPAMWTLTGDFGTKITQIRGKLFDSPLARRGILASVHPAFLLRGGGSYRKSLQDVHYAYRLKNPNEPKRQATVPNYVVVKNKIQAIAYCKWLMKAVEVGSDIETTGFNRVKDRILCIGLSKSPTLSIVYPEEFIQYLEPLFRSSVKMIWHNGKFDVAFTRRRGLGGDVDEDTMLESYALDENPGVHSLEMCAVDVIGAETFKGTTREFLGGKKARKNTSFEQLPKPILYDRVSKDAAYTLQIHRVQRAQVRADPKLELLYTETLLPASELVVDLEGRGMYVDTDQVQKMHERYTGDPEDDKDEGEIGKAKKEVQKIAGHECNPGSPIQMAELLFDQLNLPVRHGRSTNKDVLKLLPQVPAVIALNKYRKVKKAHSSYVVVLQESVQEDGRVYPTALIHGTPTGRFSFRNPAVQTIPRDKELRAMFRAPPGRRLIEPDLSQAELRSLAALSGDEFLCDVYNSTDRSLHKEVAKALFGDDYDDEEYMRAKAVNFGIVYGREAPSLAEEFQIPLREAQRMIDTWFERASGAAKFIKRCRRAARNGTTMYTCFGRKKRFGVVARSNIRHLMNQAANFPHQSIASDINLHSAMAMMLPNYRYRSEVQLPELDAFVINLVHDSILIECPDDDNIAEQIVTLAKKTMSEMPEKWGITRVPFKADTKQGYRWGYLKES